MRDAVIGTSVDSQLSRVFAGNTVCLPCIFDRAQLADEQQRTELGAQLTHGLDLVRRLQQCLVDSRG